MNEVVVRVADSEYIAPTEGYLKVVSEPKWTQVDVM